MLNAQDPTLTLTRLQAGVGTLTIHAACSAAVGDVRLGCVYQLRSGVSSAVQPAVGVGVAPPASRRPVIATGRDRFETLTVDLVQVRELSRLVVLLFSETGAPLTWAGTLVVETFGKARVEIPISAAAGAGVLVPLSVYNIDGELVLRADSELVAGSLRDAANAYGFNQISWLDERTPLT